MRLKLNTLLIICATLFIGSTLISCKNSPTQSKKSAKKTASAKKMLPAADFWVSAKDNLGLTSKQIEGIKGINTKYNNKILALKKNKKWDGKGNDKTRKATQTAKSAELKKLLGNKYPMYQKFLSKNGIKPVAKKGKKKVVSKKKPIKKAVTGKKKKKAPKKK